MPDQLSRHFYQISDNRPNAMPAGFFRKKVHLQGNQQILCNLPCSIEGPIGVERTTWGMMQIKMNQWSFEGILLPLFATMPLHNLPQ